MGGVLSGRDAELANAIAALTDRGLAVLGPAGVGKTSLARAVTVGLDPRRHHVVWLAATDAGRHVPFGTMAELVPTSTAPHATAVLPAIRDALRDRAGGRRVVLVIDDAHLLDGPSAAVLLGLVPAVRVVVTARPGRPAPDAVTSLWKDRRLTRLDLAPFDRAGTAALLAGLAGGEVAGPSVDLLHQWTGGNALFLAEMVRAGMSDGSFTQTSGLWWWHSPLQVPPVLAELLDRRFADLPVTERDALAAVALGEPLALDVLERLVPPEIVVELEDRELVRADHGVDGSTELTVRFRHPMLAAAARRRLSPARRRRSSAMLLDAHPAAPRRPWHLVRRALWHLEAHRPADAGLLLDAAGLVVHTDPALAVRFSGEALRHQPSVAASVSHADALVEHGRPDTARAVLEDAARDATNRADELTVAVALAGHRTWPERDPAAGHAELVALLDRVDDPGAREEVRSVDALIQLFGGQASAALETAEATLACAAAQPAARLRARLAQATALTLAGRTQDAVVSSRIAAEDAARDAAGLPYASGMAMAATALAQLWRVPTQQAPTTHPATGRWPVPVDRFVNPLEPTPWPLFDGYVRRVTGDLPGAIARLREAVAQQSGGEGLFRSEAAAWLCLCLAEAGRTDDAADVLRSTPPDAVAIVPGLLPWASAGIAAARGDGDEAVRQIGIAVTAARRSGCRLVELGYLLYEAEVRGPAGPAIVAPRVRQVVEHVDAPRLVVSARATLAMADADAADVPTLLGHVDALERMGLTRSALGVAELAMALSGSSAAVGRRVDALQAALGIAPATRPPELTAREAEVARLAGAGMSDRDIAEHLVLSVRTVESHLSRAYRKLHVTSRRQLLAALRP
jgi:DNA-binding CsgD family transcriptional regulator